MKQATESIGVEVFEYSPCIEIQPNDEIVAHTLMGSVTAPRLVLATNAYPNPLDFLSFEIPPFYVYQLATAPLDTQILDKFGWPGRESVLGAKNIFWDIRLTADNRLLFSNANAFYFRNPNQDYSQNPKACNRLYRHMLEKFPFMKGVDVQYQWGGRVGVTFDFLPVVGMTGECNNIYYAMGYNGHGVAFSHFAGKMIADMMANITIDPAYDWFVNRSIFGIPSATLTYLGANLYKSYYQLIDSLMDLGL